MSVNFCYGKKMRASRLLSILILLQLRGRLTAEELAGEFEVSERTIYRDIDALSAAGVPVYGDRGPGGGFQLLDGYQTRLTGLALEEAEAMPMIGLPAAAAELGLAAQASAARNKLFAALPAGRGASADRMVERFHIDAVDWYRGAEPLPHLPAIARAVLDQRRVAMHYRSWSEARDWQVDPHGLVQKAGVWYLVASGAGKMRIFRLSSIERADVLADGFEREAGFDLAPWWQAEQARFETELFSETARLRISPLGRKRLAELSPRGAAAVRGCETDGWAIIEMDVENSDHGAREMLSLGAEVEVLAPASFREKVGRLAAGIAALYGGTAEGER
jgi:predicted DNA-binding transcriptional regulator YafY